MDAKRREKSSGPHAGKSRQQASTTPDPAFATTAARGLAVLAGFRAGDDALSNSELAVRTGITRPTVSRLTHTFVELGFLRRTVQGDYKLGTKVLSIAFPLLAGLKVRQLARPLMNEFASQALGTVSLAMPLGRDFIYVETARTTQAVAHLPEVGFSGPMAPTAAGRALLSLYTEEEFRDYASDMADFEPQEWQTIQPRVVKAVEECRAKGYALSIGEWRNEIYGVAAPIYRTPGGDCLIVNCGMPSYRFSAEEVANQFGPRIRALADSIRILAESS